MITEEQIDTKVQQLLMDTEYMDLYVDDVRDANDFEMSSEEALLWILNFQIRDVARSHLEGGF